MPHSPSVSRCIAALAFVLLAARGLFAQTVRGSVRDSVSGAPIAGAVVSALDSAGHVSGRVLTDQSGRFLLTAAAGAQRLQVLHIGHLPTTVRIPPAGVDGISTIDIQSSAIPLRLTATQSVGTRLCPTPSDKGAGFALWDQARAEFLAAVVARDAVAGDVRLLTYDRDIDPATDVVTRQRTTLQVGRTSKTARAGRSATAFAANGYLDADAAHSEFYGPDADVLLDEAFAANHCFQIEPGHDEHAADIGVAFTPPRSPPHVADIAGILWIDSTTRAIRSLEYRYTGVTPTGSAMRSSARRWALGGIVTFRTLPSGISIIERWVIRTSPFTWSPLPADVVDHDVRESPAAGFATTESGAELLEAAWPGGARWWAPLGTLSGRLDEENETNPSEHLVVWLDGTDTLVPIDSTGAFLMGEVLPGRYDVAAADRMLAPFGIPQTRPSRVNVTRDAVLHVNLSLTGSATDVIAKLCRKRLPFGDGNLVVRAVSTDGSALSSASVDVFNTPRPDATGREMADTIIQAKRVTASGTFLACNVPLGVDLRVHVRSGTATTETHMRLPTTQPLDTVTIRISGGS